MHGPSCGVTGFRITALAALAVQCVVKNAPSADVPLQPQNAFSTFLMLQNMVWGFVCVRPMSYFPRHKRAGEPPGLSGFSLGLQGGPKRLKRKISSRSAKRHVTKPFDRVKITGIVSSAEIKTRFIVKGLSLAGSGCVKEEESVLKGANTSPLSTEHQYSCRMSCHQSVRRGAAICPALGLLSPFLCNLAVGTKQVQLNLGLFFKPNLLHAFVSPLTLPWKLGWTVGFTQHVSVTC